MPRVEEGYAREHEEAEEREEEELLGGDDGLPRLGLSPVPRHCQCLQMRGDAGGKHVVLDPQEHRHRLVEFAHAGCPPHALPRRIALQGGFAAAREPAEPVGAGIPSSRRLRQLLKV
eukprot:7386352-Prymnesium_polylepis.2